MSRGRTAPRAIAVRVPDPARFRWLLGAVFLGLAVPAAVLMRYAFGQLELDAFRREQLTAEQVHRRLDADIAAAIAIEQARDIDDYRFFAEPGESAESGPRSPLSALPPGGALPGTIGYFEVDRAGALSTPLLPGSDAGGSDLGLGAAELARRRALEARIASVLAANRLVRADARAAQADADTAREPNRTRSSEPEARAVLPEARSEARARASEDAAADRARRASRPFADETTPESATPRSEPAAQPALPEGGAPRGQAAFDELASGRADAVSPPAARSGERGEASVEQAKDDSPMPLAPEDRLGARGTAAELERTDEPGSGVDRAVTVSTFAVEVEPFRFARLDDAHFVLFRNAWRDDERYVQGLLIDAEVFLAGTVGGAFEQSALAPGSELVVSAGGDVLRRLKRTATDAAVPARALYTARLSPPLAELELAFAAGALPRGAAHAVLVWTGVALFGVLAGGLLVIYRFGAKQIELVRQQQDFVSAVSHELKTPLTSIRMYGEMLKSGWADEQRKKTYYDFIYAEGERLSRLIDNVLELARLSRSGPAVALETMTVDEVVETIRGKIATQLERADVALAVDVDTGAREASVEADPDALAQVFINLVDNALKFGRGAQRRDVVLTVRPDGPARVTFALRDFGPGLPPGEMKRLFKLFYRPDNELTRSTSGTGIGLALVKQLVAAMGGSVDVKNCDPGAEFRITLPRASRERLHAAL